jgi:hypothetical protein
MATLVSIMALKTILTCDEGENKQKNSHQWECAFEPVGSLRVNLS